MQRFKPVGKPQETAEASRLTTRTALSEQTRAPKGITFEAVTQWPQEIPMQWVKGIAACGFILGFISCAFWRSRGTPPSGNPPGPDANSYDSTTHSN